MTACMRDVCRLFLYCPRPIERLKTHKNLGQKLKFRICINNYEPSTV